MRPLPLPTSWSLLLVLGLLATLAGGAAHLLGKMSEVSEARHAAYLRLEQLGKVRSALLDAEAQSRGYVVSAEPACLTAFQNAHAEVLLGMEALKGLYRDNREGVARLAKIEGDARIQLDQLAETIRLRQGQGFEQAKRKMQLDGGRPAMDELRNLVAGLEAEEKRLLQARATAASSLGIIVICILAALLLTLVTTLLFRREAAARAHAQASERRALAALEHANAELARTHSSVLIAFNEVAYRHDLQKDSIEWSGAYPWVLGYGPEEIGRVSESWTSRIHPDDRPAVEREFERMRRERSLFNLEYRFRHADGQWRWLYDRGVPHFDSHGQLIEVIGVLRDATSLRTGQEERAALLRRLSNLLASMSDGFVTVNRNWRLVYLNDRACELLRTANEAMIGRTVWEAYSCMARALEQAIRASMQDGEQRHIVYFYEPWSRWFEHHVYPSEEGLSIFFRDITEARVAEQQSRQSRERLELALEAGEVGFWEWDLSSGEVFLSKQWKRQLGYEDHEIRNEWSEWESRLHPDEGATVVRQVRASALRDDGYHEIEFRLRHRDGSYRWMLSRATNHVDDQGGRRIHRGVHIDITQKKHADEERSIAQRRLHEIVSSLRDGFVALDRTWRYTFVNDAAARLLDRSRDDLIGRNIWDVFPEALDLPFHDVCLRAMQEREPLRLDQYYAPQSRWYRNHFYPTVEGIAIFFEDVSEQKRLETQLADERERYMATFEQPAIGIMHLALDGTLTRINRRMCELLGYQRTELIGKRFQDFTDTSEIERVLSQARSAPATPTQSLERTWTHRTESRFRCRGGRSFYGEFTIALVPNEGDRSAYLVCMVQDISDRKHAQALVEESRRRLSMFAQKLNDAVEQERARISREIHDELGQALTSLKMDLGWLRRRLGEYLPGGPVQLDERLRTMSRFLDETLGTVRRLATELRPALLDNLGLAAALHAQIRHLAARYDIDVEHHLESDLLLTREQATGLYRIAQEALTNIARHANASRVRARLELEGDSVLMEIEDDGIGFDPEMQSSYSLGLVGMAERARLLGGEAEIFSHPGGGTQVRVRVPLSEATEVLSNSAEN